MTEVHSLLSVDGLRRRNYQAQISLIKEILGQEGFRAFLLSYESDGLKVFARMNVPSGKIHPQGFPAVVFAHGFSPNPHDPDYFQRPYYETWINAYTRKGYLTIMPGYRGHGIVDDEPAGGYDYFEKYAGCYLTSPFYAIDVLNLLAGLPSLALPGICPPGIPLADKKNIFLSAHSMGGDVALIVLVARKQFNAASIWAGVCADVKDVAAFYTLHYLKEHKSDKPFETAFASEWNKVTAVAQAEPFLLDDVNQANGFFSLEHIETPLIIHQGMADTAVSPEWSVKFQNRLQELGKPSVMYLYEGNDHELNLNDAHSLAIQRDVEFFNEHSRTE